MEPPDFGLDILVRIDRIYVSNHIVLFLVLLLSDGEDQASGSYGQAAEVVPAPGKTGEEG